MNLVISLADNINTRTQQEYENATMMTTSLHQNPAKKQANIQFSNWKTISHSFQQRVVNVSELPKAVADSKPLI